MSDTTRPRVLIVFGGRSSEHEISCATYAGVAQVLDKDKWDVIAVGITTDGQWVQVTEDPAYFALKDGHSAPIPVGDARVSLVTGTNRLMETRFNVRPDGSLGGVTGIADLGRVDVILPLLHGPYGEDGTIQGLFEMSDIRYVGCGVTSSAASMDKHLTKVILAGAGIDVGAWELVTVRDWADDPEGVSARIDALGYPVFVKPCRAGSSIGITKVDGPEGLGTAIKEAQNNDPRVIVEAAVVGREIECGVLQGIGGGAPDTAPLGEIDLSAIDGFYDYDTKYVNSDAIGLVCPADLPTEASDRIRATAARAFDALECEGLARVDFFYNEDEDRIVINEVNTLPGFTPISMFPQMWAQAGLAYPDLLDRLLQTALDRQAGALR